MYWGGHVNLYGGILSIASGLTVETVDAVSDATRSMNLAGGELLLPGSFTGTVNNWISRGILLAYGKAQDTSDIIIDETFIPGRTRGDHGSSWRFRCRTYTWDRFPPT